MSDSFFLMQDDTSPAWTPTLKDVDDVVIPLTGATVQFIMKTEAGVTKVDAPATLDDAANGVVRYTWLPADTDTAGLFNASWQVTYSDGKIETFPNHGYLRVRIDAKL